MHSNLYKYTWGKRAYEYAHVHAIVKMQLKLLMHLCKSTYEQPYIYAQIHMYALPLSPICMLSLVMS